MATVIHQAPPRLAEIRGRAFGVTIMAFFALAWTGWGTSDLLNGTAQASVMMCAAIVSVALAALAWSLYRHAAGVSRDEAAGVSRDEAAGVSRDEAAGVSRDEAAGASKEHVSDSTPDLGRRFGLIVAVEWIGLGIVAGVLGGTGHAKVIPAVICLGVGVHFFPLARLFYVPIYWLTGSVLCAIAVATFVLAPLTSTASLWTALPGIGSAIVLYVTCAKLLSESQLAFGESQRAFSGSQRA